MVVLSAALGSQGCFGFETGGAKEPGRQGRVAADFLGFASENDEDVLGDFLCELGIEGSSVNAAVDHAAGCLHQFGEGFFRAALIKEFGQKGFERRGFCFGRSHFT